MNGSAPNSPVTGFQLLEKRKPHPSFCRVAADCNHSSKTRITATNTTVAAKMSVIKWATLSPTCCLLVALGCINVAVVAMLDPIVRLRLFYFSDLRGFLRYYFFRKGRVVQRRCFLLPIGEHPLQKCFDRGCLFGVGNLCRDQQPSKARNWIRILTGSIRNRHSKIGRHILRRPRGRFAHRCQASFYKTSRFVLHRSVGHFVLYSIR